MLANMQRMQAIVITTVQAQVNEARIQLVLDLILKKLARQSVLKNRKFLKCAEVSLVFLSSQKMKRLNAQFRSKDYATDVLSFASSEPGSLGEIVFCLPVLKRQAKQNGHSIGHEFLYMLIHGVLHLLDYDHEKSTLEAKKMFKLQDQLFSQLTAAKINLELFHVYRRRS